MADPATLLALAVEVEAGDGPDRELDARAWCALFGGEPCDPVGDVRGVKYPWPPAPSPAYTASVDAGLALAKERLQGCAVDICWAIAPHDADLSHDCIVTISALSNPMVGVHVQVKHDEPTRALLAAVLRAVAARGER